MGGQLYMRVNGSETIYLNESERSSPDPNGTKPAFFWAATSDDSKLFFTSSEMLTEDAPETGVKYYMYDVNAPAKKHLTLLVSGPPGEQNGKINGISADGSYVYFTSSAPLRPQDQIEVEGRSGHFLGYVYVLHQGELRFITTHTWQENELWEEGGLEYGHGLRISADGKTVLFTNEDPATAEQAGYENDPYPKKLKDTEVYLYRYDSNKITCVSCDPSGAYPVSFAGFSGGFSVDANAFSILVSPTHYRAHALSDDGRYVFFDTADALTPQDVNKQRDVYEYDIATGKIHLISSGTCNCGSFFVDASPDGRNVFFTTYQKLVRSDIDDSADLYDARIEGGIPAQNVPPSVPCIGDDCQAPASSAPPLSVAASSTFFGAGNPLTPVVKAKPKPKAKHTRHGKAKRKHKSRQGRKSRRAAKARHTTLRRAAR